MNFVHSPTLDQNSGLRRIFYGPTELRAGWRLLIFTGLALTLTRGGNAIYRTLFGDTDTIINLFRQTVDILSFVLASLIMGRLEGRSLAHYGLPPRKMFGFRFWQGILLGFVGISITLGLMRLLGVFHVSRVALHGGDAWKWAGVFALVFFVVGIAEEFKYRGYILFTLSTGIGFWPSAVLIALLFSFRHFSNVGETWVGLLNVVLAGLVFAALLRRSGNLWLPIGMHAGWDWAQTYFYGVPDSGLTVPGHLFDSSLAGSQVLTGGAVGPEGSVLCTLLLILIWLGSSVWLPEARYPSPVATQILPSS